MQRSSQNSPLPFLPHTAPNKKALECFLQHVEVKNLLSQPLWPPGISWVWGLLWFAASLRKAGGTKCGDMLQFRHCCKTTTAPLCAWNTVIRFFLVHSKHTHTHRRHSRGPSIHFRPSLQYLLSIMQDRSMSAPLNPQHLSNDWDDGRCPCFGCGFVTVTLF